MNSKKEYYNAPAPLFAKLLNAKERDVGFKEILCIVAERLHRDKGYTLGQVCADIGVVSIPNDAIQHGQMLREKYSDYKQCGIERKTFLAFYNEYKSDEEFALLIGYLTIKRVVGGSQFRHFTINDLLSLMSGNKDGHGPINQSLERYMTKRGRKNFTQLLTKYYGITFYTKTRGYYVSLTLSENEISEKLGKKSVREEKSNNGEDKHYQNIISEKDAEIESLKSRIAELEGKLAELTKKPSREKFSTEVNRRAKEIFLDFYGKHVPGETYYWESKDSGQMTNILKRLKCARTEKGMTCTDDELINALSTFLDEINDDWILSHLSVCIISSKFNELLSSARNRNNSSRAKEMEFKGNNTGAFDNEDLSGWG